jgi:hypothetical protein
MSLYDRARQPVADLNATLTSCFASVNRLNSKFQTTRRPFVLWSRHGEYVARYSTLEALTAAARQREEWARK